VIAKRGRRPRPLPPREPESAACATRSGILRSAPATRTSNSHPGERPAAAAPPDFKVEGRSLATRGGTRCAGGCARTRSPPSWRTTWRATLRGDALRHRVQPLLARGGGEPRGDSSTCRGTLRRLYAARSSRDDHEEQLRHFRQEVRPRTLELPAPMADARTSGSFPPSAWPGADHAIYQAGSALPAGSRDLHDDPMPCFLSFFGDGENGPEPEVARRHQP